MKPEGIVIFHTAGNVGFKRTIEKDDQPKSSACPHDLGNASRGAWTGRDPSGAPDVATALGGHKIGLPASLPPSPLALCHKARREAAELYAAAQSRGDTRAEHWALRRYRRATNALLRMERETEGSAVR
jgi:hypothetical protein